jgi:hypothetical protein
VKDWHKEKLPIAHWTVEGGYTVSLIKAWRYRYSCVAIRKRGEHGVEDQPDGAWVIFYIPTGLGIATARTREEAETMARAFEPLLAGLNDQVSAAVASYRDACYRGRKATSGDTL